MPDMPQHLRPAKTSYDEVPYSSHPFVQTHPDRLATVAILFGLRPPPLQRCRVLELGCASGGNLVPMAEQLPQSRFIGIDLSARQIADGQQVVQQLGLTNIELRHASILEVDDSYGKFDYIICHGVYSWVPSAVQDKILEVCRRNLAPQGTAYVSYNTYPGWHMRGLIRSMMRYHAEKFTAPRDRTSQARALIDFLATSVNQDGSAYAMLLKSELESLQRQADSYLFHEHLEDVNDPVFFHEFIERARAKGLQYLGEASVGTMAMSNFQPDVAKTLRMLAPDQIQAEQYMDFLRNRTFRQTLLCHQEAPVNWSAPLEQLRRLHIASRSVAVSEPVDCRGKETVTYKSPSGRTLATANLLLKAALQCLKESWPQALPFESLRERAHARVGESDNVRSPGTDDQRLLEGGLLHAYIGSDLLELHSCPLDCAVSVGSRPVVSPLARLQAKQGPFVTNRRHEAIRLHDLERKLLTILDGQHDRPALLRDLVDASTSGMIEVKHGEVVLQDPIAIQAALDSILDQCLKELLLKSLLVA